MDKKRMKSRNTSKEQFLLYLYFLKEHPAIKNGKYTPQFGPEESANVWQHLVAALNATGDGPVRDVIGWKNAFSQWKTNVKKKARDGKTPLTDIGKEIINIIGSVTIEGINTPELGYEEKIILGFDNINNNNSDADNETYVTFGDGNNMEVFDEEEPTTSSQKNKGKKRLREESLLRAYEADQKQQREGLHLIANSINTLAGSLDKLTERLSEIFKQK